MNSAKRKRKSLWTAETTSTEPAWRSTQWYLNVLAGQIGSGTPANVLPDLLRLIVHYVDRRRIVFIVSEETGDERRRVAETKDSVRRKPIDYSLVSLDPNDPDGDTQLAVHSTIKLTGYLHGPYPPGVPGIVNVQDRLYFHGGVQQPLTRLQLSDSDCEKRPGIPFESNSIMTRHKNRRGAESHCAHFIGQKWYVMKSDTIHVWQPKDENAIDNWEEWDLVDSRLQAKPQHTVHIPPPVGREKSTQSLVWKDRYLVLIQKTAIAQYTDFRDTSFSFIWFVVYDSQTQKWSRLGSIRLQLENVVGFQCTLAQQQHLLLCWLTIALQPAILVQLDIEQLVDEVFQSDKCKWPLQGWVQNGVRYPMLPVTIKTSQPVSKMKWTLDQVDSRLCHGRHVALCAIDDRLYVIHQHLDDGNAYSTTGTANWANGAALPAVAYLDLTTQIWHPLIDSLSSSCRPDVYRAAVGTQAIAMILPEEPG